MATINRKTSDRLDWTDATDVPPSVYVPSIRPRQTKAGTKLMIAAVLGFVGVIGWCLWTTNQERERKIHQRAMARAEADAKARTKAQIEAVGRAYQLASPVCRLAIIDTLRPLDDSSPEVDPYRALFIRTQRRFLYPFNFTRRSNEELDAYVESLFGLTATTVLDIRAEGHSAEAASVIDAIVNTRPTIFHNGTEYEKLLNMYKGLRLMGNYHETATWKMRSMAEEN